MSLRIGSHFVRRDFQDFIVGWVVLIIVTASTLLLPGSRKGPVFALGYAYFIFSAVGSSYVWGTHAMGHGLSRHYLLSLPVSRTRMFWICFARDFTISLPLWALGVWQFPEFMATINKQVMQDVPFVQHFPVAVLFVAISIFFLKIIMISPAATLAKTRHVTGRGLRFGLIVSQILRSSVDFAFFTFWNMGFLFVYTRQFPAVYGLLLLLPLPYFGWKLRNNYRAWVWE